jgi:hypothetical protein
MSSYSFTPRPFKCPPFTFGEEKHKDVPSNEQKDQFHKHNPSNYEKGTTDDTDNMLQQSRKEIEKMEAELHDMFRRGSENSAKFLATTLADAIAPEPVGASSSAADPVNVGVADAPSNSKKGTTDDTYNMFQQSREEYEKNKAELRGILRRGSERSAKFLATRRAPEPAGASSSAANPVNVGVAADAPEPVGASSSAADPGNVGVAAAVAPEPVVVGAAAYFELPNRSQLRLILLLALLLLVVYPFDRIQLLVLTQALLYLIQ